MAFDAHGRALPSHRPRAFHDRACRVLRYWLAELNICVYSKILRSRRVPRRAIFSSAPFYRSLHLLYADVLLRMGRVCFRRFLSVALSQSTTLSVRVLGRRASLDGIVVLISALKPGLSHERREQLLNTLNVPTQTRYGIGRLRKAYRSICVGSAIGQTAKVGRPQQTPQPLT